MQRYMSINRSVMLGILTLQLAGTGLGQSILGVVEIDSWRSATEKLSTFCRAVDLPYTPMKLNHAGGEILNMPDLAGLDVQQPVRLFFVQPADPRTSPVSVAMLPLLDETLYIERIQADYEESTRDANGVIALTRDAGGIVPEQLYVMLENGRALVADASSPLAHVVTAWRENRLPEGDAAMGSVRLSMDPSAVLAAMNAADIGHARNGHAIGKPFWDIMGWFDGFCLGLDADSDYLTMQVRLDALSGTPAAEYVQRQRPTSERYRSLLPGDARFGVVGGAMDATALLAEPYLAMIEAMLAGTPESAALFREQKGIILESFDNYSGDYAGGLLPDTRGGGMFMAQVYAVENSERAQALLDASIAAQKMLMERAEPSPVMALTRETPREYGDVTVQTYALNITLPDGPGVGLPVWRSWFDDTVIETALSGNDQVTTFGRRGAIDQILDRLGTPSGNGFYDRMRPMFTPLQIADASEVMHIAPMGFIHDLLQAILKDAAAGMANMLPPPGMGIGGIQTGGDALTVTLRVAADEFKALAVLGKAMQALGPLLMQEMMGSP